MNKVFISVAILLSAFVGCAKGPTPGPDKQGAGMFGGAAVGAGSGAVIGAQVAAGTGPGALAGAGFGAVIGALKGAGVDILEEEDIARMEEIERLKTEAWAQEILADHYDRRLRVHPNRDIYPADLFFEQDKGKMSARAKLLVRSIAKRLRGDMPWSRILITSYLTSSERDSEYADKLNSKRGQELALQFVRAGVEPRRLSTRGVILDGPLVIDPQDLPGRYRQAIEILPLDY